MKQSELLEHLYKQTEEILVKVSNLKEFSETELRFRENNQSWNVLECIEHLNLYSQYYIPEIEKSIQIAHKGNGHPYSPGLLGDYFAKSMLPTKKLNKMKTFKDKNPLNKSLSLDVFDEFTKHHESMLSLIRKAENVNINKVKITVSISKLIRIRLGDTFRFVINHELRHLQQIEYIIIKSGAHIKAQSVNKG